MTYNSIFTACTDSNEQQHCLDAAIAFARQLDAHLDVVCVGVDRTSTVHLYSGANAMIQQDAREEAERVSLETSSMVRARLEKEGIRWTCDECAVQLPLLNRLLANRARFSDLVLLPPPYGANKGVEFEIITEAALFEGRVPVLICPEEVEMKPFRKVVLGWNESPEALAAARAAMPMLKMADKVNIAIIDPPSHSADRSDPGGMLSTFLSRHGITSEISVLAKSMPTVTDVMLRHLTDQDADLLVMGAYGHSRFRESILGGATRDMLENLKTPVFLAH